MYFVKPSSRYKKSLKRVSQYRNFDSEELDRIVIMLARGEDLDLRHHDHLLKGEYLGIRECHIKNDLLLLYQKQDSVLILLLVDIGTQCHSNLWNKTTKFVKLSSLRTSEFIFTPTKIIIFMY